MRLLMWEPVSFSFESFFGDKGSALWEKKKNPQQQSWHLRPKGRLVQDIGLGIRQDSSKS